MSQPRVKVVMPEIKLTVADLAYLNGLNGGEYCHPTNSTKDRCIFLGLVEKGVVPVCPKELATYEAEQAKNKAKIRAAVKADNWEDVYQAASSLHYPREPRPRDGYLLTPAGKQILAKGHATATVAKKGCAK